MELDFSYEFFPRRISQLWDNITMQRKEWKEHEKNHHYSSLTNTIKQRDLLGLLNKLNLFKLWIGGKNNRIEWILRDCWIAGGTPTWWGKNRMWHQGERKPQAKTFPSTPMAHEFLLLKLGDSYLWQRSKSQASGEVNLPTRFYIPVGKKPSPFHVSPRYGCFNIQKGPWLWRESLVGLTQTAFSWWYNNYIPRHYTMKPLLLTLMYLLQYPVGTH